MIDAVALILKIRLEATLNFVLLPPEISGDVPNDKAFRPFHLRETPAVHPALDGHDDLHLRVQRGGRPVRVEFRR